MHIKSKKLNEVELLTSKLLDDNYSDEELFRLNELLGESKDARKSYANMTMQDSLLHWESVEFHQDTSVESVDKKLVNFPVFSSIAAAIVVLFGVWWLHSKETKYKVSPTEIISSSDSFSDREVYSVTFIPGPVEKNPKKNFLPIHNLSPNSIFSRFENLQNDISYGVALLKNSQNFGEGGVVEFVDNVAIWKKTEHLSVPTENGVLPKFGDQMIKFSTMRVDVHSRISEASEMLQVVDVRNLKIGEKHTGAQLQTKVFFNKGNDLSGDSTEFALSFLAIASNEKNENSSIGHQQFNLESDVNPSTWEEVKKDFIVPTGTEFVIVSMSARKEGPNALLPDVGGHYADGLSINLLIDGKNSVGPL